MSDEHAERFTRLRPLLFTIAYEILGAATEAEDVLQDAYLRWAEVDLSRVDDTKAYLARLVTRQALNALRAQSRRREEYVGPWLPEPVLVDAGDASSDVVLAESVSMAMMVVLETLGRRARGVRAARGVRVRPRRDRRGHRKVAGSGTSNLAPGTRTRAGQAPTI
jgi:RNA polymerase sigma-70 factor (ECF subfamily)